MQKSYSDDQAASVAQHVPPPLLPRLARPRLHDTVVEHLRQFIVEGVFAPGTKLNERELCETLGISRTPLREALKVLAAEGLIDLLPNRGASISRMSEAEVRESFELMSGLEAFSGELACERITAAELAQIKALHYAMLACRAQNDLPGYYSRNQEIHDRINEAARNGALRFRSNQQSGKWDEAVEDHEEMIQALEARDGKRLAAVLKRHLLEKRDAVLPLVSGDGAGAKTLLKTTGA
ncbi:putative Transcriptional regulator, GntR family [Cupriavidus taiwanensis]|uniref:GntR family transcriptional regulator n=1 Tax=Cupriavidus taiwanensis TaxID=164546 RepID=UPI000E15F6A3|nr:GntR family transcriptional regulator [Cupriavidus taiwanensis]SOZ18129.1 putative Transcriptional regulator, GntR family [Cupriavidus taiwanensis]SOZ31091.1 putative Transcriptional regulator, GntR family [Cupriavidus taiwanensis]SOZ47168.1 putative Transcriptional regulator, GntR family [Cupriavidus taiwanensis]